MLVLKLFLIVNAASFFQFKNNPTLAICVPNK